MSSDAEDQIINELANIRKEVTKFRRGASLSVAFGVVVGSLMVGFIFSFLQYFLSIRAIRF